MPWTLDIQTAADGTPVETAAAFAAARIAWTVDGPGAIEVDLRASDISVNWEAGTHRVVAKLDGTAKAACYLTRLARGGPPGNVDYKASGVGLAYILDWRIVRHAFGITGTGDAIVSALLDEAQAQFNGDMGFTMGTVTGTLATRTRGYCFGVGIGDAIRDLASIGNGFDWEVDADGALNLWQGTRGVATGETLAPEDTMSWEVEADTADLVTNVSTIGDQSQPFGPIHRHSYSPGLSDDYGRHEVALDVDSTDGDELIDAATGELEGRSGARMRVHTMWIEGRGPWTFGDVWLQDRLTLTLPTVFGGDQSMRCTEVSVSLDPGVHEYVEHTFEALISDVDETDPDEGS